MWRRCITGNRYVFHPISEDFRKRWRDQFYGEIVEKALKANVPDQASYAAKKIVSPVERANSLGKIADHYIEHADPIFARGTLEEAVKFAAGTDTGPRGISSLITLIPIAQKIDPNYVFTLSELTTRSINAIPALNIEDKPQTENYKKYVNAVTGISWNLMPVLNWLIKVNRNAATDLANRINKKEIKIAADFVLAIDSLNQETDQKKPAEAKSPLK